MARVLLIASRQAYFGKCHFDVVVALAKFVVRAELRSLKYVGVVWDRG